MRSAPSRAWALAWGPPGLLLVAGLVLGACRPGPAQEGPAQEAGAQEARAQEGGASRLTVGAAASLRQVMPALVASYRREHPETQVAVTYGASGDLRKQVEGGAPMDAVVFASGAPVDALVGQGLVAPDSRRRVATNVLVLVGPRGAAPLTFRTLPSLPAGERLAIGEPGAVPAGQYAREALTRLGHWKALKGRLVYGGDVAAVLAYARRGEVPAAVVYRTDVRGVPDLVVLDEAVTDAAARPWAPRAEVVAGAVRAEAWPFVEFLSSPGARPLWAEHGFGEP